MAFTKKKEGSWGFALVIKNPILFFFPVDAESNCDFIKFQKAALIYNKY